MEDAFFERLAKEAHDPLVFTSQCWDDGYAPYLAFNVGTGDLNSGSHTCTENTLPTQPSSQPRVFILFYFAFSLRIIPGLYFLLLLFSVIF